jgi:hypothetical protein
MESTLIKETISRAKSRWVAEEVKRWVTENHQVGTKELQKKLKEKFKIDLPCMRVFNGKNNMLWNLFMVIGMKVSNYCIHSRVKWRGPAQVVL